MKSTKFTTRQFFIDGSSKNYLVIKSNNKIIKLSLRLEKDNFSRYIGTVTKSTKTLELKRERAKHLFIKGNAYGFNDYVLRNAHSFDMVRLSDEFEHWKVPVQFILESGEYLNFSEHGLELQRFVSLEKLQQFKINKKESRRI